MRKKIYKFGHKIAIICAMLLHEFCYYNPFWSEVLKVNPAAINSNFLPFLMLTQNPAASSGASNANESDATANSSSSSSSESSAPQSLGFSSPQFRMIPGVSVNYVPSVTGTADSWSLSPSLPNGLTFNTADGSISGTPDTAYLTSGYPSTTFTITATNSAGSKSATFQLQVLASGDKVWTVINGVSGGDTTAGTNSMKYDATCNCLYIAGVTSTNLDGQTRPSTGSNSSGYLSKYDLNGNRIWTRLYGTSGAVNTSVEGLVTDSSGNIYLTGGAGIGNFNGINITVANNWPFTAGYIIKYDANGNVLWTTSSSPSVLHYYSGIVIANSGNVVVAGTVVAGSIDGMTGSSSSDQSAIIQEFNPNTGARISGQIIPGSTSPARGTDAMGLSKDSSGNIYAAIATRTSTRCGDDTLNWRPALFRFDASMSYLNCTFIPTGTYPSFAFGVTTTPAGESYLSGYVSNPSTFDSIPSIGSTDGFVTKFDNSGTKQWTRRIGVSGGFTSILSVEYESAEDMLYFTGITDGNINGNVLGGTKDMFIAKYDTSGNQVWLKIQGMQGDSLGGNLGDRTSIAFDASKTMYSFSNTNGTVSGITNPANPNRGLFLVRNVR